MEKLLKDTVFKLTETNANVRMFRRMIKERVATNDIRTFLSSQMAMKRAPSKLDLKLLKQLMRSKLNDLCAYAKRLRQLRDKQRLQLFKQHKNCKTRALNEIKYINKRARLHRS